jgi:pilus assembly protein CpaB
VSRTVLFGLGLLTMLAGGLLIVLWLYQPSTPKTAAVAQAAPPVIVLLAARPIPPGTLLRLGDMVWDAAPPSLSPPAEPGSSEPGAKDIVRGTVPETDYVGAVARHAFAAGEPLTADALVKASDPDFLVAALEPGHRAVSIAVDEVQSTSGLAFPGDRVDIVLTQDFSTQGGDLGRKAVAETVLHNLRIIAIDQTLTKPVPSTGPLAVLGEAKIPKTITLDVTDREAETLLVSQDLGKLELAVRGRGPADAVVAATDLPAIPTWASDVSPALRQAQPAAVEKSTSQLQVIHGAKVERFCHADAGLSACP